MNKRKPHAAVDNRSKKALVRGKDEIAPEDQVGSPGQVADDRGRHENIKQNTRNQGYQQDR